MRLFVALDLPLAIRTSLFTWASKAVGSDERLRLVACESLHVTLVFLGERPDADAAVSALPAALGSSPPLALGGPLWLSPRRPHVLTVALVDPSGGLNRVHAAVLDAMVRSAGHKAETRRFRPHVTVARVRGRVRPFDLPAPPALQFSPPSVTLYRSRLDTSPPAPAQYEAVSSVPFSTLP